MCIREPAERNTCWGKVNLNFMISCDVRKHIFFIWLFQYWLLSENISRIPVGRFFEMMLRFDRPSTFIGTFKFNHLVVEGDIQVNLFNNMELEKFAARIFTLDSDQEVNFFVLHYASRGARCYPVMEDNMREYYMQWKCLQIYDNMGRSLNIV